MRKQKGSETRFLLILDGFGSHLGPPKRSQDGSKIDVEKASKFDQFLKASWNTTFSAQEAPRRASAANRRRRWSRPGPGGGGFRRGKTRTSEKKNPERDKKKNPETWCAHSTRRPRLGGGL